MQDTPRRRTTSAHASHVPARLQAEWAELVRQGGLSDQKINKGTFLRIEKLSFWESPVKIRDVAGTPTLHKYIHKFVYSLYENADLVSQVEHFSHMDYFINTFIREMMKDHTIWLT